MAVSWSQHTGSHPSPCAVRGTEMTRVQDCLPLKIATSITIEGTPFWSVQEYRSRSCHRHPSLSSCRRTAIPTMIPTRRRKRRVRRWLLRMGSTRMSMPKVLASCTIRQANELMSTRDRVVRGGFSIFLIMEASLYLLGDWCRTTMTTAHEIISTAVVSRLSVLSLSTTKLGGRMSPDWSRRPTLLHSVTVTSTTTTPRRWYSCTTTTH
mmetsp:Transcript_35899/g.85605  ORF Transcript_35899/g.85605 Transcript_35899/m.85605 type:complete len:209 (+) Transcript_35899:1030-1656(+)